MTSPGREPVMTSHPDADALMRSLLDRPADPLARLVFADWLEETATLSNVAWARYIRLTHADRRPASGELARFAGGIRAKLSIHTRFFLNHRRELLALLPAENIHVRLCEFHPPRTVADWVPESVVRENEILPLDCTPPAAGSGTPTPDRELVFASKNPRDTGLKQKLGFVFNAAVVLVGANRKELSEAIHRVYGDAAAPAVEITSTVFTSREWTAAERMRYIAYELELSPSDAPIPRLAALILSEALTRRATAVQVRPTQEGARVTYLIDGNWIDRDLMPSRILRPLADRFRLMGGLDPEDHRARVEWGLIRFPFRGRDHLFLLEITETAPGPDILLQFHEATD